jgi:hypothetical protein
MALKPNESLAAGTGLSFGMIALYDHFLPNVADHKAAPVNNMVLDKARQHATLTGIAIVAGISFLAKSTTMFVIGGTTVVALDFAHRHANAVNPASQKIAPAAPAAPVSTSGS